MKILIIFLMIFSLNVMAMNERTKLAYNMPRVEFKKETYTIKPFETKPIKGVPNSIYYVQIAICLVALFLLVKLKR